MDFDILNETITPLNTTLLSFNSTGGLGLPIGTTAQRPTSASAGAIRWNTTTPAMEYYNGASWTSLTSGTVTSISSSSTVTGLTLTTLTPTTSPSLTLSGTLGIASGGTGQTVSSAAFNALSPLTTLGDTLYANGANTNTRLAGNTSASTMVLTQTGTGTISAAPIWATVGTASFSVNVGPSGTIAWTLVSGNTYTATITHNLGTQNVIVQTTDISNSQITYADVITITSATQIVVQVSGVGSNLKTLRTTIIANGASIAAGASTPSSVIVQNNGVGLSGTYTTLNLVGVLAATNAGAGVATISNNAIIRTLSYVATSLDSPNNADWVVNALAATISDPLNGGINIRQFSNTVEQGVGLTISLPATATNIIFTYKGRSASATAGTLQMKLYNRTLVSATPAAVGVWTAATNLTSVSSPANVFYQSFTQTSTLSSLSLTAGNTYQFEFTRNIAVAGNLAFNWYMLELGISFT